MTRSSLPDLAVVGGGPAGLMAAEQAIAAGLAVHLYDAKGSVGRKFLLAGKGGLNLTHGEPRAAFEQRYGARREAVGRWLDRFDADALRVWAREHGVETFVGSSGRVFPTDRKAAPLLRGWVHRLREAGVVFHMHHRWLGWSTEGRLRFDHEGSGVSVAARATVLALGGASWPQLGSDGAWVEPLRAAGIAVEPLRAANCGFEIDWSAHLRERFAGAPLKPLALRWLDPDGGSHYRRGECVLSDYGIEGSLVYAAAADLRERLHRTGSATVWLDLAPDRDEASLGAALAVPRGRHSVGDWLRRRVRLDGARAALLFERTDRAVFADPAALAARIKALPLALRRPRPVAEAISTAGGIALDGLDADLMLRERPGVFCAGEMLDWEAPTGGYLLTACFASGLVAGRGAVKWLARQRG